MVVHYLTYLVLLSADDATAYARLTTVEVQVNLDATTLAGLAENPGDLAGYGPTPAEMACDLAAARRPPLARCPH